MTKSLRNKLLCLLAMLFIVFSAVSLGGLYNKVDAKNSTDIITDYTNATVKAQGYQQGVDDGRKGVQITTESDKRATVTFGNNVGPFDLEFRALSSETGVSEIGEIRFEFVNKTNVDESFWVYFTKNPDVNSLAVSMRYKKVDNTYVLFSPTTNYGDNNPYNIFHLQPAGSNFANEGKPFSVCFNPFDMTVAYKNGADRYDIVNLSEPTSMKKNFATLTPLNRIDEYDVIMHVYPMEGCIGNVLLYSINGESLGDEAISDTQGPSVDQRFDVVTGLVGREYNLNLSEINIFDQNDGYRTFNGSVKVENPSGVEVPLNDGKFIPTVAGTYKVTLSPSDNSDIAGSEYVYTFEVKEYNTKYNVRLHYDISDSLINNNKIRLPFATFIPEDNTFACKNGVSASIYGDGTLITTVDNVVTDFDVELGNASKISVIYSTVDQFGDKVNSKNYTVNNNGLKLNINDFKVNYVLNDYVYVDDCKNTTSHEAISPTGVVSSFAKVCVDEIGLWQINYYYEDNGVNKVFTQYINCECKSDKLWTARYGMTINPSVKTPDYFDVQKMGIELTSSSPNACAIYNNTINVSSYTKQDCLLEFMPTPYVSGTNELKKYTVLFEDLNDETRTVKIVFYMHPFYEYATTAAEVWVGDRLVNQYAYLGHSTLHGKWMKNNEDAAFNNTVKTTFDYKEKILYIYNDYEYRAVDLADPLTIGVGNEWKGFTNDELRLSVVFTKPATVAHVNVFTVDNMSLASDVVKDTNPPSVVLSNCDMNNLPKALVGEKFPVMDAYGIDSIDGVLNVNTSVVYVDDNGLTAPVSISADGSFIPEKEGLYNIIYTVTDSSGNEGYLVVDVEACTSIEPMQIDIDLDSLYPSSIYLGEKFVLYPANGTGGSGEITLSYCVKVNGEIVEPNGVYVTPDLATENCVVEYTLKDYLGHTAVFSKKINVILNDNPVFSDVVLPSTVIMGKVFKIPTRTAKLYQANGSSTDCSVEVRINDVKYTGSTYTPTTDGQFKLSYVANGYAVDKIIKVVDVNKKQDAPFLTRFFELSSGVTVDTSGSALVNSYISFNVENDSSIFFINPLNAKQTTLKFILKNSENNFEKINFIFQNVDDPDEKIVLSTMKNPDSEIKTGLLTINGGTKLYDIPSDYTMITSNGVDLGIYGNKIIGYNDTVIATVDKTFDGNDFKGFTSDKFYLTVEFEGVSGSSVFNLKNINNQTFKLDTTSDKTAPDITLDREFIQLAKINEVYTLPNMYICDVLDDTIIATMTITSPSKTQIYNGEFVSGYSFTPNELGKYMLYIEYMDSNNRKRNYTNTINVISLEKPVITLLGDVPTEGSYNGNVTIPKMQDTDGIEFVSVLAPSGVEVSLNADNTFVASEKGSYKVIYYLMGLNNVVSVKTFNIDIK